MSGLFVRNGKPDLPAYKIVCVATLAIQALLIACFSGFENYEAMCLVSIIQLALFVILALASPCKQPLVILFLVANWIFHCGQIVCIAAGYGTDEVLNLDFRWYGSSTTILGAFFFYLYSQTLVAAGSFLFQRLPCDKAGRVHFQQDYDRDIDLAKCFLIVGLPFWLYVNGSKLIGAASDAYRGVYSLIIPAPIQALSFFFEAGLLLMLLCLGRERKGTLLFWTVVAINVVLMSTGSRQYAVCFLAVWCLIYFYYLKRLSIGRTVGLILASICLLFLVDAFGELRTTGFSLEALFSYLGKASFFDLVWDSLGEFGSAFSTLVASLTNVPSALPYGMGASYIAGGLSIIPTLVSKFPILKVATQFTSSIGAAYLGGSMLGEFFYNFGYFGIAASMIVGGLLAWCQNCLNELDGGQRILLVWASSILAVFLLLFIRGYFTDAIMKIAYVFMFYWLASNFMMHSSRCGRGKHCRVAEGVDAV